MFKDPLKKAQLYKNEGNKFFKAGKYEDAITMYSKAIEACPSTEKSDVFYQNRAAAYEQLVSYLYKFLHFCFTLVFC